MAFDKHEVVADLKRNNPNLYRELQEANKLENMSADEILFLDASSASEAPDLSHIPDSELPPVNMDIIDAVIAQSADFDGHKAIKTVEKNKKFLSFTKIAAAVVLCVGLLLSTIMESDLGVTLLDSTTQETTDYAIRVRDNSDSGIFHEEFVSLITVTLEKYQPVYGKSVTALITPVEENGEQVTLTLKAGQKSVRRQLSIISKTELSSKVDKTVAQMFKELAEK